MENGGRLEAKRTRTRRPVRLACAIAALFALVPILLVLTLPARQIGENPKAICTFISWFLIPGLIVGLTEVWDAGNRLYVQDWTIVLGHPCWGWKRLSLKEIACIEVSHDREGIVFSNGSKTTSLFFDWFWNRDHLRQIVDLARAANPSVSVAPDAKRYFGLK